MIPTSHILPTYALEFFGQGLKKEYSIKNNLTIKVYSLLLSKLIIKNNNDKNQLQVFMACQVMEALDILK